MAELIRTSAMTVGCERSLRGMRAVAVGMIRFPTDMKGLTRKPPSCQTAKRVAARRSLMVKNRTAAESLRKDPSTQWALRETRDTPLLPGTTRPRKKETLHRKAIQIGIATQS